MNDRIAALEAEIKAIRQAEHDAAEAKREAFKRQWRFTIARNDDAWDKIHDDTIVRYRLRGDVLNAEEYKAIGGDSKGGGMNYLFNTGTGRIVLREGGGSIFIPERGDNTNAVYDQIAAFLSANPDGGDVTDIIMGNPEFSWK